MSSLRRLLLVFAVASSACDRAPVESAPTRVDVRPRRLTHDEFDNTVRDLLGTDRRIAATFPEQPRGLGFDNIESLQTSSPDDVLRYESATETLAREAIAGPLACRDTAEACLDALLDDVVPRAWRRPLRADERDRLQTLHATLLAEGLRDDEARAGVLQAVLLSPAFLHRIEVDPQYEMASRLSYFLWSSMPDEGLFDAAAEGVLHDPATIESQVERMLDDPRASALVERFAGQWLHFRALDDVFKDHSRFPSFDDALRDSMRDELDRYFASFIHDDRDLRELLTADTTTVDHAVLQLYGVASAPFEGTRPLDLAGLPRRGLLTMPGMMTLLARPFRTAPVKRGAWVLSQLLCEPPPPPPDGVEGLGETVDGDTVRERLAQHREDPACASCHDAIDPLGLAFESYDALGRWRPSEDGFPIDPSGVLPDGTRFADAVELSAYLANSEAFLECAARQLMTYALGRELADADEAELQDVVSDWREAGFRTRALFVLIARTRAFRGVP